MEYTVVLCDNKTVDPEHQAEILGSAGADIEILAEKTESAVATAVQGAHGIIVDAATPVTADVLHGTETLQVVGRAGIGVDNVDVAAATDADITVVNVPDYALEEVSTHALSLLLTCIRKITQFDSAVKEGDWDWSAGRPLHRLAGQTLGLVGFGGIARRLAGKLRTFGLDIVATDPRVPASEMADFGVEKVSFEILLDTVDHVSIHVPLYEQTHHLFSTAEFERLDDDCILVNTARGPVVDETALVEALATDQIGAAALDVRENEPPAADSRLHNREDVVLTPHTAWYSEESRADLSRGVASGVAAVLRGEQPAHPVDPETPWI